jgi:hypothetical protein
MDGTIQNVSAIHDEEQFATDLYQMLALKTDNSKFKMTPEILAKTLNIGRTVAEKTLKATKQQAVRTVASPTIE